MYKQLVYWMQVQLLEAEISGRSKGRGADKYLVRFAAHSKKRGRWDLLEDETFKKILSMPLETLDEDLGVNAYSVDAGREEDHEEDEQEDAMEDQEEETSAVDDVGGSRLRHSRVDEKELWLNRLSHLACMRVTIRRTVLVPVLGRCASRSFVGACRCDEDSSKVYVLQ